MDIVQSHHLLEKEVFRPLLNLTKDEISEICNKYNIPYIHDETNDDPKTSLRNLIRIKLLPQFYNLSNKKNKTSNSFIQSFQNIYEQLDQQNSNENTLKDINKSAYRNCKF
jgi:tRNA(Ile)-lysidine synthase